MLFAYPSKAKEGIIPFEKVASLTEEAKNARVNIKPSDILFGEPICDLIGNSIDHLFNKCSTDMPLYCSHQHKTTLCVFKKIEKLQMSIA